MQTLARRAAIWWRSKLVTHFNSCKDFDYDEALPKALFCTDISEIQLSIFEEELFYIINKKLKNNESILLTCNFYPCELLEHCSNLADIEPSCFLWHNFMKIEKKKIYVATSLYGPYYILDE